ncbi:hypothetical protein M758_1G226200 [Ceratodon purpureus]|nr:hypothetical protein M758_1G226200 [Ceratodon purpureus]
MHVYCFTPRGRSVSLPAPFSHSQVDSRGIQWGCTCCFAKVVSLSSSSTQSRPGRASSIIKLLHSQSQYGTCSHAPIRTQFRTCDYLNPPGRWIDIHAHFDR